MAYVAVVKALYDYTAQDLEDELSFSEDQILYIVEKGDDEWWKAKLKEDDGGQDGPVGLIPCTYVEEMPPINQTRSMYSYESTSPEEVSMDEEATLYVYAVEDEWLLVRVSGGSDKLGFVPRNYCEEIDASTSVAVAGAEESADVVEAQRREEEEAAHAREVAEHQRQLRLKDKVQTWSVAEMDGNRKKNGTLGVGNGAIFFASETDKSPVKQCPITDLLQVEPQSDKVLVLSLAGPQSHLVLHTGSAQVSKEIIHKLEQSKEAAGEALELTHDVDEAPHQPASEDEAPVAPPPTKQVRWAEETPASPQTPVSPSSAGAGGVEQCVVLYDFEAGGDDELTVAEGETLTVVEKEDEWWLVRNSRGAEGVVPAQYVEAAAGGAPAAPAVDPAAARRAAEAEAAQAAAAAEARRREEVQRKEEARRAIEEAAVRRAEQEAADHEIAEQIEVEERAKQQQVDQRMREEEQRRRYAEAASRREAARGAEPPKVTSRGGGDAAAAARNLPSGKAKATPAKPSDPARPKPNPARTRVWSDRTGQFKVEAEFLGMNGNKLRLHKLNGVIIEVPMEKMSPDDTHMIKRYLARKERQAAAADDDDLPLGQAVRKPSATISQESSVRAEAQRRGSARKQAFDWFAFFLDAGCGIDDCTRYAANFDRDRIDESILPELDGTTLRSLGLREGDVIRVRKVISGRYGKKTPEQAAQLNADEDYARKLQEHEDGGGKGPAPAPPPGLFTNPEGKLTNNTRRGRPERRNTLTSNTVDTAALGAVSEQLSKVSLTPIEPTPAPPVEKKAEEEKKEELPKSLLTGFDDDAWEIKPAANKPASPAPATAPPKTASPPPKANGTDALLAQISNMRPASADAPRGGNFDVLAELPNPLSVQAQQRATSAAVPARTGSATLPPPSTYGLGAVNSAAPMAQIQQPQQAQPQMPDPNAPRGPLAPVRANEGLLNPLQPSMTGMFVPTHPTGFQQPMGMQQTGMPIGMGGGMLSPGYQQPIQPAYTGIPFQQQQNNSFNAIANLPPPQLPQPTGAGGDMFAPSNIFNAMKRTDFGKSEETNPQAANKYDALRPLTTGYNGAPGMFPQNTGMPMQMQGTGMPMGGMMPMGQGMYPQATGYNPQMMGQYGQYGQGGYGQY
ncbi:hypothetical protein CcaverHIS002_0409430 [Cutaneotrichosporon cavernicola]|uniref:Actin cytoskeleton-regulatory complex protein SLA1 n=1 Tax=Cutaneotrichosporon cavernicola TaxID=279322 RepID=A0AA48QW95_9TREE|nr:uncharacterized protein CcaverHIS019_0409360 [Cutaneotrichosporon cavernicola]BEI84339.1 hypothetical protein CcaverHIS002_0409430 [Cutaneotrichosporon cavernicola]BEI92116.1 hypothetical protein CcaverHIS019_0409360 [Cutaneotrichosporon cavernicola]BEI99886.1 hypothetical protein CcaverHIS631_0409290 [Cutaneotrichosporon cavernicola]BEJ07661.1 hypothetical protein CcaverHIS641_0409300 [Cutaneotrichosporon cavernicola]